MKKDERLSGWIQTYTGKAFWPLEPRENEICIEDIAHALSNKCRFSGHTIDFYSVAQHSVIVSNICNPKYALWGLLHDASEAYLVDLPSPLKKMKEFNWFVTMENNLQRVICKKFGLEEKQPQNIHDADITALVTEKRDVMGPKDWGVDFGIKPLEEKIVSMSPDMAKQYFLNRYHELTFKL